MYRHKTYFDPIDSNAEARCKKLESDLCKIQNFERYDFSEGSSEGSLSDMHFFIFFDNANANKRLAEDCAKIAKMYPDKVSFYVTNGNMGVGAELERKFDNIKVMKYLHVGHAFEIAEEFIHNWCRPSTEELGSTSPS